MGLREDKAAQTRELMIATALELFLDQGYDTTTMGEIAEQAHVGESTLYRYFPTKDLLVLEPLAVRGHLSVELTSRPADEPLDLSLGHALRAVIVAPRAEADRLRRITTVLEGSLALQGRLTEQLAEERRLLERALAERLGRPVGDPYCVFTARVATTVLEIISERVAERADEFVDQPASVLQLARDVMDELRLHPPALPRLGP
jgi:AcrR family transcriptional regulator